MLTQTIMVFYRTLAITIIATPMLLNIKNRGEIIDSLIYIPLLSLALTFFFIWVDKNLEQALVVIFNKKQTILVRTILKNDNHHKIGYKLLATCKC